MAAAVILPHNHPDLATALAGVNDSKKMSPSRREQFYPVVTKIARAVGIGTASRDEVDEFNVLEATRLAMARAIADLGASPDHLLLDHITLPATKVSQSSIPKGDGRVVSIAAASVIAKVYRDRLMVNLAGTYPGYGFERHKGYGTANHRAAIVRLGPCPAHRLSYRPLAEIAGRG